MFSGHSARAGQTLAKEAIKVKKSAGAKAGHRVESFIVQKFKKNTGSIPACQAFSKEGAIRGTSAFAVSVPPPSGGDLYGGLIQQLVAASKDIAHLVGARIRN